MKRGAERVITALEARGYEFVRTNSKHAQVYSNGATEIAVLPSCDDNQARMLLRRIGAGPERTKRNAAQVKDRAAAERERAQREIARIERERAAIEARKRRALGGIAARMSEGEVRAIERRIEQMDLELNRLRALMTETPAPTEHRAHHRSGQ